MHNGCTREIYPKSDRHYTELLKLSLDIQLLSMNPKFYRDIFGEMESYKHILIKREYGSKNKVNIKQEELYSDFMKFYTTENLKLLDIYPQKEIDSNWVRRITRYSIDSRFSDITYLHHLMFIRFLKNIKKDERYKKAEKKLFKLIDG